MLQSLPRTLSPAPSSELSAASPPDTSIASMLGRAGSRPAFSNFVVSGFLPLLKIIEDARDTLCMGVIFINILYSKLKLPNFRDIFIN